MFNRYLIFYASTLYLQNLFILMEKQLCVSWVYNNNGGVNRVWMKRGMCGFLRSHGGSVRIRKWRGYHLGRCRQAFAVLVLQLHNIKLYFLIVLAFCLFCRSILFRLCVGYLATAPVKWIAPILCLFFNN